MSNNEKVYNENQPGGTHKRGFQEELTKIVELGEKIKELRKKKDMSLRMLARQTGISVSYLSRLESGEKKNPSATTLNTLSRALGEELYFYMFPIRQTKQEEMDNLLARIESLTDEISESFEKDA